jgi:hypothetical protein
MDQWSKYRKLLSEHIEPGSSTSRLPNRHGSEMALEKVAVFVKLEVNLQELGQMDS